MERLDFTKVIFFDDQLGCTVTMADIVNRMTQGIGVNVTIKQIDEYGNVFMVTNIWTNQVVIVDYNEGELTNSRKETLTWTQVINGWF